MTHKILGIWNNTSSLYKDSDDNMKQTPNMFENIYAKLSHTLF